MAVFNVNDFITSMAADGARPNLFEITFAMAGDNFNIRAKATAIPGSNMSMVGAYYFGRLVKFAGNRNFADWSVSVLVDEGDFEAGKGPRAKLESWMDSLNSHTKNTRAGGFVKAIDYQKDATVVQYGKTGEKAIATYKMTGCFPIDIGAMPLDWGNNNAIMEFPVTFAMQYWTREGITT
jgi:hypothetical protein